MCCQMLNLGLKCYEETISLRGFSFFLISSKALNWRSLAKFRKQKKNRSGVLNGFYKVK
jgi:hypothetical protein